MQKDNSSAKVKINVKKKNRIGQYRTIVKKTAIRVANGYKSREVCVPRNECYRVIVVDLGNDGLCCNKGTGFVRISRNGEKVFGTRMKNKRRKKIHFGTC